MTHITGGCLCGQVRYTITAEPLRALICHCRDCQRYTGSPYEAVLALESASFQCIGEFKTYRQVGGSGLSVDRHFCPHCGSGVMNNAEAVPGITAVLVGTLDEPEKYAPSIEIFCNSALPWVHAGAERLRFAKGRV